MSGYDYQSIGEVPAEMVTEFLLPSYERTTIQVNFFHEGVRVSSARRATYHRVLGTLWRYFGIVTSCYYQPEFHFCLLKFQDSKTAREAMASLNDEQVVLNTIRKVIHRNSSSEVFLTVQRMFLQLMVRHSGLLLATPGSLWTVPVCQYRVFSSALDCSLCSPIKRKCAPQPEEIFRQ
ncbi:hypothetical protein B484DRAFT_231109 [Ochromonadaceae sp. CCMP2298]|nr:hypothetical protein B484DRAFT_231109 [Ochromonadaceae sp. CCMP2298]